MKILFLILLCVASITASAQKNTDLRVATYNIRYYSDNDGDKAWPVRRDNVKALIGYHDYDILGVQEAMLNQINDLLGLSAYAYAGHGRDDGKDAGEHSAIVYKTAKFEILESGDFWLREDPSTPGKGWDATCCNRICSWAKFKEKASGKTFYFFNVHFDHQGVIARQESGKLMVQKMKEIAKDAPTICTGDFNSVPETEQIQTLSAYLQNTRTVSQTPPYGPVGTFNRRFHNPIGPKPIDYIFVSKAFTVLDYATLTDNNGMFYPSDHIPVVVNVELK